ncbi:Myeloid leukemia factor 1 [Quillaja saponaria]|uniref:Myeloid leukemia factor 1 n=1 Tax=Quillaja saponaria TaxID=32244 RepID=A0AAD7L6G3_QUISA|nr:Myeloid leukemia factor 1 [Quillaja saponaria]
MDIHPGFLQHQAPEPRQSRGPIIEELNSDDEIEDASKEKKTNPRKHGRSSNEPLVVDPDDEVEEKKSKQLQYRNDYTRYNQVTFEECKEADTTTGQAAHMVARGLHDKGHSLSRKLHSDGKVDTMQTLHNLNEDELTGFEEAWKGNAPKHLPGLSIGFNGSGSFGGSSSGQNGHFGRGGWALPSTEHRENLGRMPDARDRGGSSQAQPLGKVRTNTRDRNAHHQRGRGRN